MNQNNDIGKMVPLVLDLDGTLLRTDSLWEMLCLELSAGSFGFIKALCGGKVALKKYLAERARLSPEILPWNDDILALGREAKKKGREVWLATAACEIWAEKVAENFGFFSGVLATNEKNLKGEAKAAVLAEKFGLNGYDYAGDAFYDLPVWEKARAAYVVTDNKKLVAKAAKSNPNLTHIPCGDRAASAALNALRPHQWAKNALLFTSFFLGHIFTLHAFLLCLLGFCLFCMVASSGYMINDLLDLTADRRNPEKRFRPFAAGILPVSTGFLLASTLMATAFILGALLLPPVFSVALIVYAVVTLLYSLRLKRIAILDVIILSLLYVLRIAAGIFALSIQLSLWIFIFSLFIFLALALCKRIAELRILASIGMSFDKHRDYQPEDLHFLCALSASAICAATMTLALYVGDALAFKYYVEPQWLLLFCPVLLFWLGRFILLAWRGKMKSDPVLFALKDKISLACLGIGFILYTLATLGV